MLDNRPCSSKESVVADSASSGGKPSVRGSMRATVSVRSTARLARAGGAKPNDARQPATAAINASRRERRVRMSLLLPAGRGSARFPFFAPARPRAIIQLGANGQQRLAEKPIMRGVVFAARDGLVLHHGPIDQFVPAPVAAWYTHTDVFISEPSANAEVEPSRNRSQTGFDLTHPAFAGFQAIFTTFAVAA